MYLLSIYFENARRNGSGSFCFKSENGKIRRWTLLPRGHDQLELLRLMALACGGPGFLVRVPYALQKLRDDPHAPLHLEFMLARHAPRDAPERTPPLFGSGLEIDDKGRVTAIGRPRCRLVPRDLPIQKPHLGNGNSRYLFLGYGSLLIPHMNTDDFDFTDPFHRITRFHSLFSLSARITDPVAFLTRLHYKGVRLSRYPSQQTIGRLTALFREHLEIDTGHWLDRACDFQREWAHLRPWQQRAALPVLDAVRHMLDASPLCGAPLEKPGVMLLDRPDLFLTERIWPRWIRLMDDLLPAMQFVLTLSDKASTRFPPEALEKRLHVPSATPLATEKKMKIRLLRPSILLIDMDSRLPNLALMKLSRYHKERGQRVTLVRGGSRLKATEAVYASCVFSSPVTRRRADGLRKFYGDALVLGGSGVDIRGRLPQEIEDLPADYGLYPELGDRAIGFITRGCPYNCPFCIVPVKEGKPRQVSDLDELLQGGRKKLILLDDNILSHPNAPEFLEDMVRHDLQVNFTQTLDVRLLDKETARLIRRIRCSNTKFTRSVYHFSLNDAKNLGRIRSKYHQMGFTPKDNVEFICMYGYNTTLAEDVKRFRFLRSLPGTYVFVQQYKPIPGGPSPDVTDFFDDKADDLIDELIKIVFTQNMKSMEKYYRWVSRLYAMTFGKLHMGLVDTIFRYNHRHNRGRYIARLAGTRKDNALP